MHKTSSSKRRISTPRSILPAGGVRSHVSTASKGNLHKRNQLNDLTAAEWISTTVSVWMQKGLGAKHPDAQIERQHPAPFSFTDVSRLIRYFTKRNGVVLDPFVGVGSTLKACALESRIGVGVELNPRYVRLSQKRLKKEVPRSSPTLSLQKIIKGDARKMVPRMDANSVDFVVTSPPYASILHKMDHKVNQTRRAFGLDTKYSNDMRDLGNIRDYDMFLHEVTKILGECGRVLKPRKYMAVIVSDFRDKSRYVMFHSDLAREMEKHHLATRGIIILYQNHKRVFPYGYPFAYVPNIHHQYILILQNAK